MRLETKKYIGNNEFRLETKFVDWKQWLEIGNPNRWLETCFQSTYYLFYVSNLITMIPMYFFVSNLIFMFPIYFYVSNLHCFQCMFPIYILPTDSLAVSFWSFEKKSSGIRIDFLILSIWWEILLQAASYWFDDVLWRNNFLWIVWRI